MVYNNDSGLILDSKLHIGPGTDMETTCYDWANLATCKEIIGSRISSFTYEASKVYGAKLITNHHKVS